MGAQFIHQNTYSMQLTAGSKKENSHTVASVLAEGWRDPEASKHVENPQAPIIHFGSRDEIITACEKWLDETKDPTGKKVRKDANCLIGGVFSCSPEDNYKWEDIRDESIKYLQEKFGERLICIIEHEDEPFQDGPYQGITHKHAHYYVVPLPGEQLELIHEGKKAVAEVKKSWNARIKTYAENPDLIPEKLLTKLAEKLKRTTQELKSLPAKDLHLTLKKSSNVNEEMYAFRRAMRGFQDQYYAKVGARMGLTRTGPRRERLTKAEHNARKEAARTNADLLIVAKELAFEEGKQIGLLKGFDVGYEQGKTQGVADGFAEGKSIGYAEAFAQGFKEGETKGLQAARQKFKEEMDTNPISQISNAAGAFAGAAKAAFLRNLYVDKIKKDSTKRIEDIQKKLKEKVDAEIKTRTEADARVSKIALELNTVKANRNDLNTELDRIAKQLEDHAKIIEQYQKLTGIDPKNLPKPK